MPGQGWCTHNSIEMQLFTNFLIGLGGITLISCMVAFIILIFEISDSMLLRRKMNELDKLDRKHRR